MKPAPGMSLPKGIPHLAEVFKHVRNNQLPRYSQFDLEFKLTANLVKISSPLYPLTILEEAALDEWIDEMQPKEWIFKHMSPVYTPLLFVEKADGTLRPCVNYRLLNNVTVLNPYPHPLKQQIAQYVEKA